jgi:tyrosyl-tRNA synthetase
VGRGNAAASSSAHAVSLPILDIPHEDFSIVDALVSIGFVPSRGEAKRKIAEGAVRIDDEPVLDPAYLVTVAAGDSLKLSLGKKKHGILKPA